jgi:hypothetical protein
VKCPYCGFTGVSEDGETNEGDVLLCTNCAGYFIMESGAFRPMTEADTESLSLADMVKMIATKRALLSWAAANNVKTAYTEELLTLRAENIQPIEE